MSWFGTAKYPQFEEKIKDATSESIPNGEIDFATALEVSDMIRSKQVPPKESMRSLKRRFLEAENVNTQKSAFKLIDFCIKNGGEHFINEIASKEFMDPLVAQLKEKTINEGLKSYLLEHIQTWSIMVSKDPKFDYINKTYRKLQDDGFEFPMISDVIDSTMIDSKVAPEWQDSDACMMCSKMFTFINRKHHCRSCGGVFCAQHSSKSVELPELGINIPVRVCDNCYTDQKAKRKKNKRNKRQSDSKSLDSRNVVEDTDDEIKRAIELSLKETAAKNSHDTTSKVNATVTQDEDEDEDEAMKAAIAASLQDLNNKNSNGSDKLEAIKEPEVQKDSSTGLYSNLMSDRPYVPTSSSLSSQHTVQERPPISYSQQQQYFQAPQPQAQLQPHSLSQPQLQLQHQKPYEQRRDDMYVASNSNTIRGIDETKVVDFIQLLDNLKGDQYRINTTDPRIIQLHSDMVLLHPKIGAAIANEHSEIEKFQSLYSKLFAISRLYDDILQSRLKQEQDMLKSQHNSLGPPQSYGRSPYQQHIPPYLNQPVQYLSPQSTFNQHPQVHQLQAYQSQSGTFQIDELPTHNIVNTSQSISPQATCISPSSQFTIPSTYPIPAPSGTNLEAQQLLQMVPSSPYSHKVSAEEIPRVKDFSDGKLPISEHLRYASVPETVSEGPPSPNQAEPKVSETEMHHVTAQLKKEPEIVNLIDL
ncbi:hypothetical protein PICMEDRAFT_15068 [Pichia membranifaciens NRRL Y-2026]|uniref:Vacuolar protein sorting-associated protein 27 n=1 Tax=Pichia membranifaciens NRRL Y-2026 TaxID=763406 RepID=A0A1E3NLQ5_9ASCO|nr:hypothetical protein PICMEDRAFT_15068 [Pichia membranifaciens NRRL Y-2026]ODQ47069.1 hypothetical protein PICMEDRAFT_15068 [Pichia membranifaciens NRRL Y-2026]